MRDMVTPCLEYVVGMKLVTSYAKFPQAPFCMRPFWRMPTSCQKPGENREEEKIEEEEKRKDEEKREEEERREEEEEEEKREEET